MAGDSLSENPLLVRTREFAIRVMKLRQSLPNGRIESMNAGTLMRCGTSVGANYRSACRARSASEFRAKLGIVEEDADESIAWMELIGDCGIVAPARLTELVREANEILAMMVASIRTSKRNNA